MSSFNQQECLGCSQPCDGLYCYQCTCQQCGVGITNGICLNCTFRDEKPLICCKCEGPLRGGLCWFCASNSEISFNNDPNPNSFDDSQNLFDYSSQPQYETYLCELCGNDSHYGYDCPPRFSLVYDQEPCYNQNYNENYYPHNLSSFLCCDNCESPHESFQCQSMNQNFFEPNPCYEPNSSSFDQYQPSQSSVTQQLPQRSNEDIQLEMAKLIKNNRILLNNNTFPHEETSMGVLLAKERILKLIQAWDEKQIKSLSLPELLLQLLNDSRTIDEMLKQRVKQPWERFFEIKHAFTDKQYQPEEIQELMCKLLEDLQIRSEEMAKYMKSPSWNHPTFYNNDVEHSIKYKEYLENSSNAITTVLPTKEPDEYEVTSDNESECDVPVKDESSPIFTTFLNRIFDYNVDFTSSDDELLSKEDVPMENFKIYSNPLFDDEEINSNKVVPHYFNAESDLIESLSNRDTLFDSSPKFDYIEEFSGELMPTRIINEERIKREREEYISLMKKLLTINSFPRLLENFHANTIIETLPTSPVPVEDSDSIKEIGMDDFMPPGIESDDYDSEGNIHFLEELLSNDSISLPENESSNFDHHDDSSFPHPPPEPLDVEIFFEPDSSVLTTNVVKGISEHYVFMPNILPTLPTFDHLYLVYDTLLLFSSENEDKVFEPGILSYLLVSHRDKTTSDFFENPMMMYGGDIPSKDCPRSLKTLVFGVLSRFTRASHPLLAISLGKSDILDHYRLIFIAFSMLRLRNIEDNVWLLMGHSDWLIRVSLSEEAQVIYENCIKINAKEAQMMKEGLPRWQSMSALK
nr:hypothetical protein [Tanacetum cinerariifolium]